MLSLQAYAGTTLHIFDVNLMRLYIAGDEQLHSVNIDIDVSADEEQTISAIKRYAVDSSLIAAGDEVCLLV